MIHVVVLYYENIVIQIVYLLHSEVGSEISFSSTFLRFSPGFHDTPS